jgi:NAD(P)-dependent dehydrogenase (short-subunit alcohol dehydrogenase family)
MSLKGKVAMITGGGQGLGRAIALAMARDGARVAVMARTEKNIAAVVRQIKTQGGQGLAIPGDVSQEADVARLINETVAAFSAVHVLVNNAAVIGPPRFLADADSAAWNETLNVNLTGAYLCTRSVVPVMVEQSEGKIINITSGLGQMAYPRFCAYSVSKAGLIQLTRSLAEELKEHNIQVNAIDPGVMDTAMQEAIRSLGPATLGTEVHRHFVSYQEKGALKDPHEVARLAVFLASPESDNLTGHWGTLGDYRSLGWKT